MEHKEKLYWYWISKKQMIGNKTIDRLLQCFGSMEGVFHAKRNELMKLNALSQDKVTYLLEDREEEKLHMEYQRMELKKIRFLLRSEEEYPEKLRNIYDPPWYLYVKGMMPDTSLPALAVIGARNCSFYGKEVVKKLTESLAGSGIQIISGLAKGIDGYAHEAAIEGGGRTFGVLGNGVDICYPFQNEFLYKKVEEHGGLISEYAPGINALPFHFPLRNRIISGLSDGILVIEAREKSGTLITVDYGLEQGRDIYAVPGKIGDLLSYGCNRLIQQGAKMVLEPGDILEELKYRFYGSRSVAGTAVNKKEEENDNFLMSGLEKKVFDVLTLEPKHAEVIANESEMAVSSVLEQLVNLELKQMVIKISSHYYIRKLI